MIENLTVACYGDSLTRGIVSYNWVKQLSTAFADQGLTFLNFGKNGELAYNLLQRIDEVIEVKPEVVILLIGSNDAMGSLDEDSREFYTKLGKLPKAPHLDFYAENLVSIAIQLKDKTDAKVIMVTLPPLGEVLSDEANRVIGIHNNEIRQVCERFDFHLLDLNKELKDYLIRNQGSSPYQYRSNRSLIIKAAVKKYLLLWSWNQVAKRHKMILTHDGVHLNEVSGGILANLVYNYFSKAPPKWHL